ncbi:hypothetical protein [Streptomyces sp. NPDC058412]|uniref:hypothetical protein n=1 Tax=Streptomyces sp. NPDC058412 TaxID=3346486 RepID=UPI00364F4D19
MWGLRTNRRSGAWYAFTTDPLGQSLGLVGALPPEHGRTVLLFRVGGYRWDGTAWYRPGQAGTRSRRTLQQAYALGGVDERPVGIPNIAHGSA